MFAPRCSEGKSGWSDPLPTPDGTLKAGRPPSACVHHPGVCAFAHSGHRLSSGVSDPLQVADVSAGLAQGGQPEKEGRAHPCLECGRSFASAAALLHHSRETHGRERIHVCPVCRKAFKRATHLKVCATVPTG